MDPNETLHMFREAMREAGEARARISEEETAGRTPDSDDWHAYDDARGQAAEHAQALDDWLSKGGFLPDVWTRPAPLDEDDARRIRHALNALPYSGSMHPTSALRTAEDVAVWLEAFGTNVLAEVAATAGRKSDELATLQRDLAAVRRVLGTSVTA